MERSRTERRGASVMDGAEHVGDILMSWPQDGQSVWADMHSSVVGEDELASGGDGRRDRYCVLQFQVRPIASHFSACEENVPCHRLKADSFALDQQIDVDAMQSFREILLAEQFGKRQFTCHGFTLHAGH